MELAKEQEIDRWFQAMSDPTRRDIVRHCLRGEQSVSTLAGRYPMSFAAVQKHVATLQVAGLITKRRNGREQLVSADISTLRRTAALLAEYEQIWRLRVDRISDLLAEPLPTQLPTHAPTQETTE